MSWPVLKLIKATLRPIPKDIKWPESSGDNQKERPPPLASVSALALQLHLSPPWVKIGYWILVNLDKRERSGHLGKLGEFWGSGTACNLLYRLLVPFEPVPPRSATAAGTNDDSPSESTATKNPYIPDDEFGIKFYEQIRGWRDRRTAGPPVPLTIGSWAGDRIICVGEYADNSCLPPNLLAPTQLAALEEDGSDLYTYAQHNFTPISGFSSRVLKAEAEVAYPKGNSKAWVLRNLTKRVYVDLSEFGEKKVGGLDQFVLTNICWSDQPDGTFKFDITDGKWAGDKLDVNVIESVQDAEGEPVEGETAWVDVTQGTIQTVGKIWRSLR